MRNVWKVTILILIDGFLQCDLPDDIAEEISHNPYFNRWFSAITVTLMYSFNIISHNPYFNRWFSAIGKSFMLENALSSHNPYFNRWFSAIHTSSCRSQIIKMSQSLF